MGCHIRKVLSVMAYKNESFGGIFLPHTKLFFRRKFLVRTVLWFVFSVGFSLIGTIINIIKFAVFNIPKDA